MELRQAGLGAGEGGREGGRGGRGGDGSVGGTDGRSEEESRPYLRQFIRDTHIVGQLFKAHSCITQPKVPVGLLPLSIHPGPEGQRSEMKV